MGIPPGVHVTASQAASVVDAAFDVIAAELAAGCDVAIAGISEAADPACAEPR